MENVYYQKSVFRKKNYDYETNRLHLLRMQKNSLWNTHRMSLIIVVTLLKRNYEKACQSILIPRGKKIKTINRLYIIVYLSFECLVSKLYA